MAVTSKQLSSSFNSISSLDLETSWAAKDFAENLFLRYDVSDSILCITSITLYQIYYPVAKLNCHVTDLIILLTI